MLRTSHQLAVILIENYVVKVRPSHAGFLYLQTSTLVERFDINKCVYRQIFNIRRTKSQNLDASRLVLQFPLCNILKPDVKSRMKM